ncbi:MAG: hypothetical protein AAGC46_12660 [Solirubrobacteraceae bacterium]|nr:hypothetical protein [Patulibacter sp.]
MPTDDPTSHPASTPAPTFVSASGSRSQDGSATASADGTWRHRIAPFLAPDMVALTPAEAGLVAVVLAIGAIPAAVLGWSFLPVIAALLPGVALSWYLRARAAKTRPKRTPVPGTAFLGAGFVGATGSSYDRYFGLYAVVVILVTELQRRTQPVATEESTARRADRIAGVLGSRRVQLWLVAGTAVVAWIAVMAVTQIAACATPKDGGTVHGPQGPFTQAFCGTPGAPSGDVVEVYLLIIGLPLLALAAAVLAVVRLRGGPKHVLGVAGPAIAPASVALAWVLAGAR